MDPQIDNNQDQTPQDLTPYTPYNPSEPVAEAAVEPTQPQQPVIPVASKSHVKLFIGLAVVVVLILVLTGYLVYQAYHPATKSADVQQVKTPVAAQTVNPTLEAATNTLTGSALSESALSSTDDSNAASDASTSANNVGDSIDENNF